MNTMNRRFQRVVVSEPHPTLGAKLGRSRSPRFEVSSFSLFQKYIFGGVKFQTGPHDPDHANSVYLVIAKLITSYVLPLYELQRP